MSFRFILGLILYGSIYGSVHIINELFEGQSHSAISWLVLFAKPFLFALTIALGIVLLFVWVGMATKNDRPRRALNRKASHQKHLLGNYKR